MFYQVCYLNLQVKLILFTLILRLPQAQISLSMLLSQKVKLYLLKSQALLNRKPIGIRGEKGLIVIYSGFTKLSCYYVNSSLRMVAFMYIAIGM